MIRISLWFLIVLYIIGACLFFFQADLMFAALNYFPNQLGWFNPIPDAGASFWQPLVFSMMLMLVALSWASLKEPQNTRYLQIHLLSKIISTAGFFYMFWFHGHYFAYLAGVLTDGHIALFVYYLLFKTRKQP